MKYFAVIDTNVLVSALLRSSSIPGIIKRGIHVDNLMSTDVLLPDPKDIVFYRVVMEVRKDEGAYLVTGNLKHFPAKHFIVTPREMLEILDDGKEYSI